ncbi:metallophosphoesterase family protein [Actinokineospora sp.]|uniref:metallophosphoesterase family protein n=1 Tax=Actinokineospora sp. TaxID=1872133 RepID=UPI003D6BE100
MLVAVRSDTHAPRHWKGCPAAVAEHLRGADLILHAGDVCTAAVLDELAAFAPVHAVLGNNDGPDVAAWGAPEILELDLDGLRVEMIHDSGKADGRAARLRRRFPDADLDCPIGTSTTSASTLGATIWNSWSTPPGSTGSRCWGCPKAARSRWPTRCGPERVSRLVLVGAYGRGTLARADTPEDREEADLDLRLGRIGWRCGSSTAATTS